MSGENKNCWYCRGRDTMEPGTQDIYTPGEKPHVIQGIPAMVCVQCGDAAFTSETVRALELVRDGRAQPTGTMKVDTYDSQALLDIIRGEEREALREREQNP